MWAAGDVHTMYVGSERWKYSSFTSDCEATVTKITTKMVFLSFRSSSRGTTPAAKGGVRFTRCESTSQFVFLFAKLGFRLYATSR